MWDRSYRWQRFTRIGAGGLAVALLVAGTAAVSQTEAAGRAADGIAEISREAQPDNESTVVCDVPAVLGVRKGVLVYREGRDGTAEIIGRVIKVDPAQTESQRITVLLTPS